jgi:hypothetical protein
MLDIPGGIQSLTTFRRLDMAARADSRQGIRQGLERT